MKLFQQLRWDRDRCRRELEEFRLFLAGASTRNERQDVLPFFKARKHLSALIGSYSGTITQYDLLAHEYPLFGDYTCDLVIGDSARKEYGFVEFEIAAPNNIFVKKPNKATPQWAPRFEQGYSQLVDWFNKLNEMEHTPDYIDRFGKGSVEYFGLLVIGRNEAFHPREVRRFAWRQAYTKVDSKPIYCRTFDQLYEDLERRLNGDLLSAEVSKSARSGARSKKKRRKS